MALDFPNSPTVGQIFTSGTTSWTWDGTKWVVQASGSTVPLPISGGGTGQNNKTGAFDALSPLTNIGDILSFDGTHNIRVPGQIGGTPVWWPPDNHIGQGWPAVPMNGRLTLASYTPVLYNDVVNANTIYYTPYGGPRCSVWNGNSWDVFYFGEVSLVLNTSAHVAGGAYDLWLIETGAGGNTLTLASGPAWTSGTARAATGGLYLMDGIYVNASAMTCIGSGNTAFSVPQYQATYVGSFRCAGAQGASTAGQTSMIMNPAGASGGNVAACYLWNMYHRQLQTFTNVDNGASYSYGSGTVRIARASGNNFVQFIWGLAEDGIIVSQYCDMYTTAAGAWGQEAIGVDSSTAQDRSGVSSIICSGPAAITYYLRAVVHRLLTPQQFGFGLHFVSRLEMSSGASVNFAADNVEFLSLGIHC